MGLSYIKIQDLIPKQQKNLADVSYLDLDFLKNNKEYCEIQNLYRFVIVLLELWNNKKRVAECADQQINRFLSNR